MALIHYVSIIFSIIGQKSIGVERKNFLQKPAFLWHFPSNLALFTFLCDCIHKLGKRFCLCAQRVSLTLAAFVSHLCTLAIHRCNWLHAWVTVVFAPTQKHSHFGTCMGWLFSVLQYEGLSQHFEGISLGNDYQQRVSPLSIVQSCLA